MGKKYDSYIELAPGYESVVDINSDNRNNDFWSHYIVNDDIVQAVKYLGRSLRPDDPREDVKHFLDQRRLWHRKNICCYRIKAFVAR